MKGVGALAAPVDVRGAIDEMAGLQLEKSKVGRAKTNESRAAKGQPPVTKAQTLRPVPWLEEGTELRCAVCGGEAEIDSVPWSDAFTDYPFLSDAAGKASCAPCYWIAVQGSPAAVAPVNPTRSPRAGQRGYLLADRQVTPIPSGLGGLEMLAGIGRRTEPFGVLLGSWKQTRHYWLRVPVAYGAGTYPVFMADGTQTRVCWLSRRTLDAAVDLVRYGLDDKGSVDSLKSAMKSETPPQDEKLAMLAGMICPDGGRGRSDDTGRIVWRFVFGGSAPGDE